MFKMVGVLVIDEVKGLNLLRLFPLTPFSLTSSGVYLVTLSLGEVNLFSYVAEACVLSEYMVGMTSVGRP
jgi:hypothetical protein